MKKFTIQSFLCVTILCGVTTLSAQKKFKTLTLSDSIVYATVDRPGDLYVITKKGQIQKFDIDGNLLRVYQHDPTPTLFDPRDGARLFVYFRNDQHYAFLNPSFEVNTSFRIDSAFVITPWLACVSGDHNLWILDGADKSLKKINVSTSIVEVDVKIPNGFADELVNITFMREYQGFLFLLNQKKGIQIFNALGIPIRAIEASNLPYFNFIGEELYYPAADTLMVFNLFTTETKATEKVPGEFVLRTDERIYGIQGTQIDFYKAKH